MDEGTLRLLIIVVSLGALSLWLLSSFLVRAAGVWERVADEDEPLEIRTERLTLAQLGPFVRGKRQRPGGEQEFSGWILGRTIRLTRRDHGVAALVNAGFPREIAQKLDGEIMARLTLAVRGDELVGAFHPVEVKFTHQPPRITAMQRLPPVRRAYRRVAPTAAPASALVEELDPPEPA